MIPPTLSTSEVANALSRLGSAKPSLPRHDRQIAKRMQQIADEFAQRGKI